MFNDYNKYVVIGKELPGIEDISKAFDNHKKLFFIDYETSTGKYITVEDFDNIIYNDDSSYFYWESKVFIENAMIMTNGSVNDLPSGDFNVYSIKEIKE